MIVKRMCNWDFFFHNHNIKLSFTFGTNMGQGRGVLREKVDDVKRQIGGDDIEQPAIYQLLNVKDGGGKLIDLIKESRNSVSLSEKPSPDRLAGARASRMQTERYIDEQITNLVKPMLYNDGQGKWMNLSRLSLSRFGCTAETFETGDIASSSEYQEGEEKIKYEERIRRKSIKNLQHEEQRFVCWKLEERGVCGETVLHICFLLSTTTHMELARRLLRLFPKLINDIYTNDVYFGESSLVSLSVDL